MIHELKIKQPWFDRVAAGEKRAEVRKHDRDFQVGDEVHLYEANEYGRRVRHYVERDERGRFVNAWVDRPPVRAFITHVLPGHMTDGLDNDYCVLSIEVVEG